MSFLALGGGETHRSRQADEYGVFTITIDEISVEPGIRARVVGKPCSGSRMVRTAVKPAFQLRS